VSVISVWGAEMAIYRSLSKSGFEPEDTKRMGEAYERALVLMRLSRSDPQTETLAQHIIEVAQTGEKDPDLSCARAMQYMGVAK
jgi:hypothetical protein